MMCCCNSEATSTTNTNIAQQEHHSCLRSNRAHYASANVITSTLVNMSYAIKPLNLQGGQCTWCGKYGHKRVSCPLLK